MFQQATILGGNGGFGQLFAKMLKPHCQTIIGVDVQKSAPDPTAVTVYVSADCTKPNPTVAGTVSGSDLVIMCLPETALDGTLGLIAPHTKGDQLLADTTSVKSGWAGRVERLNLPCEWLSLNPTFVPDIGFTGQDVAAVEVLPGPMAAQFCTLIEGEGARVVKLSAYQHDRMAAISQIATHVAAITYGAALADMGFDLDAAPTTPAQRALLRLVARIASLDPEVYWHIQHDNPFALEGRKTLAQAMGQFQNASMATDSAEFKAMLQGIRDATGTGLDVYAEGFAAAERAVTSDKLLKDRNK